MRNPGPNVLSPTEKVNILLAISHKRSAAKHCHKEPTLRAASWSFSSGEGDGCVWFNFSWVSRKNISLLPLVTLCVLPDTPFLSILPGDLCKSVLSSPSTWPFGVSCYFSCLWLSFTHMKIKGQIICWLGIGTVSLTAEELLQFTGCRGSGDRQEQTPYLQTPQNFCTAACLWSLPLLYCLFEV